MGMMLKQEMSLERTFLMLLWEKKNPFQHSFLKTSHQFVEKLSDYQKKFCHPMTGKITAANFKRKFTETIANNPDNQTLQKTHKHYTLQVGNFFKNVGFSKSQLFVGTKEPQKPWNATTPIPDGWWQITK